MDYYTIARNNMVKNQIMTHHVNDERILEIMGTIPRHMFLDGKWQSVAYCDGRIPIDDNRAMLSPTLTARMIQALELKGDEKVLDIGCGTGYSTALLANLASYVVAIESIPSLAVKAAHMISYLKYDNVAVKTSNLLDGAKEAMPFDRILINGALLEVPDSILSQLKVGGKLVGIIKFPSGLSKVVLYNKHTSGIGKVELFEGYADNL